MSTINTNVAAIKARGSLDKVQRELNTAISRLSSGNRITRAHDDASGLAISGRMESQIRGLSMNVRNAKDGQALVDTQEGALQEITNMLQRMRELAVQASSGSVNQNTEDKGYLQLENKAIQDEIIAVGLNTQFNGKSVLDGSSFSFYTDIDTSGTAIATFGATITGAKLFGNNAYTAPMSIGGGETVTGVAAVISLVDQAIATVAGIRANLGAISNRFDHVIDNLSNVIGNTEDARSRVQDSDFAVETTALTRNTILQQSATTMVAQANAVKNTILALIQG